AQEFAMDLPITHEAFAGRGLAVRTAGFFKGPRLIIDGGEVKGKRLRFSLRDNSGQEREIRLKTNGLDPVPKVQIGGQAIELARPLAWYEYVSGRASSIAWPPIWTFGTGAKRSSSPGRSLGTNTCGWGSPLPLSSSAVAWVHYLALPRST